MKDKMSNMPTAEGVTTRLWGTFKFFEPYKNDGELQDLLAQLEEEEKVKISFDDGTYNDMSIIEGLRIRINERLRVLGQELLKNNELRIIK